MNNSKISGLFLVARKQLDFEFFLLHFVGASLLTFGKFIWVKKKKEIQLQFFHSTVSSQ